MCSIDGFPDVIGIEALRNIATVFVTDEAEDERKTFANNRSR
jgi:hypothetical protein